MTEYRKPTGDELRDALQRQLPHRSFDLTVIPGEVSINGPTMASLRVRCYCGRALKWPAGPSNTLPMDILMYWLADHDDDMFLTDEQQRAKYEAAMEPMPGAPPAFRRAVAGVLGAKTPNITNFHIDMPPLVPPVTGIAEAAELFLKPIGPVTFDANLFQWLIDEEARITALHGPRLTRISGCPLLLHWLMRQFPAADPGVTAVNLLGSIALTVDEELPFDSLRLTYVDGTHKDVRVIEAPDPAEFRIEMPPLTTPMTFAEGAPRFLADGGRPLLYDPDRTMGDPA